MDKNIDLNLEVKLKAGDKTFNGNIRSVVEIDESILNDEFAHQPSLYAWFATLAEIANADLESAKFSVSVLKANLDKEKRAEFTSKGTKVTEAVIDSAITTDPSFIECTKQTNELARQYGILKCLVRSLEQRSQMLMQLGACKRQQDYLLNDFGIDIEKVKKNNG